MKAIILAGGFGTRISKISNSRPKPLMEVSGKSVLEHQIEFLLKHGIANIRLSLYHKPNQIINFCLKRWPGKVNFVIEPRPLGTGGALKFASAGFKDDFIVLNGDILSDVNLGNFISKGANTLVCTYQKDVSQFGMLKIYEDKIIDFLEKTGEKIAGFINAGIYLLHPDVFDGINKDEFMIEIDVFPELAKKGELNAYLHEGYWIDMGTEERYRQANLDMV